MSYGSDPSISTEDGKSIQIVGRATIYPCCWNAGAAPRTYIHVLENSMEQNAPMACLCIPANFLCPGSDMVSKTYFDRGPWDRQTLFYTSGCYSGPPTFYANSRKQVCCCVDCCDGYNNLVDCFIPECCGDKIIYSPYDTVCFCCPNKVNFCCNNCGLLGLKSGEPLCVHSQYSCLQPGTGEAFAELMNQARQAWAQRTGHTGDNQ
ncbi:hypothetical protein B484DRAFT_453173 [Ochromonadaceae sp. CCMP2298]|nr:hypothetical protein B484DRAFT_453173 [Ochromonadaceae sp. CCMP2298]|mmetsp:Transcript_18789/g.41858  ORF Transcript_18789/g.41858 Transcript_18789/m.41858 type:complete len:206 (-) Transcript_18789:193-810(-)|eukprot:CAMPEP_0173187268 /NCGR_PEP_ID=MMETSP1141-20130122/10608_1 /TAXON_ID=483371 /ORGANISM="non described non described, Strain CCMP2298" /LENGTH=205 /DNA_ID=CAMNT_0014111073 /DNA_START=43 /DNA_END=660 /DNA_ORIENTATION=+